MVWEMPSSSRLCTEGVAGHQFVSGQVGADAASLINPREFVEFALWLVG